MTQAIDTTIRALLRAQLLTVAGLPAEPFRKWEGFPSFSPPDPPQPWIRETVLRGPRPRRMTMGPAARMHRQGIYQVDVFVPGKDNASWPREWAPSGEDTGSIPIELLAESIRDAFPDTLQLSGNGVTLYCFDPSTRSGAGLGRLREDGVWLVVAVEIPWHASTFAPA